VNLLTREQLANVRARLELAAEEVPFVAEDETGATYNYGEDPSPTHPPSPSTEEWLGIVPDDLS